MYSAMASSLASRTRISRSVTVMSRICSICSRRSSSATLDRITSEYSEACSEDCLDVVPHHPVRPQVGGPYADVERAGSGAFEIHIHTDSRPPSLDEPRCQTPEQLARD